MGATIAIDISALRGVTTGIPRYIQELVGALGRLEGEERYLALRRGAPQEGVQFPGVETISAQVPLWLTMYLPWTLLRRGCRLVHFPYAALPPWLPCPCVVTMHDLSFVRNPEWFTPEMVSLLRRTWLPALRRADHIICISDFTRRELIELQGVAPERMTVTLLGAGSQVPPAAAPRPHLNGGRPYVLGVGTLQPRKNYPRLIEAFARAGQALGGFDLCLAGVPGWKHEDLAAVAARCGVGERLKLPGAVSDQDLQAWYQHATALALPSLYEGFGLPLLEAMAMGVPCLTSDRSALPEVAAGAAVLVDPTDGDAIAQGLIQVCLDQELRSRLRERGRQRAAELTWERCAQATRDAYRRALGRDNGGGGGV